MKITKSNLLNLWNVFEGLQNEKKNVNFSYFIAKNKIAIKGEVDALNSVRAASEDFLKFETERVQLAQSMADKMPGTEQPMIEGNQYIIKENAEEFAKLMEDIRSKYKNAISDREAQVNSFNKLLTDEIEFEGSTIKLENLPVNIEPGVIEILLNSNLIEE